MPPPPSETSEALRLILLPVELRVAGRHDRRHRDADQEGVAARRRQRLERLAVEHAAGRRVRRLDERRLAGDGDRFLDRADFERDVERDELLRADDDALCSRSVLKPVSCRLQRVGARRHRREVVLPDVVGDRLARDVRRFVGERTATPGMTPLASRTAPRTPPVNCCAPTDAAPAITRSQHVTTRAKPVVIAILR